MTVARKRRFVVCSFRSILRFTIVEVPHRGRENETSGQIQGFAASHSRRAGFLRRRWRRWRRRLGTGVGPVGSVSTWQAGVFRPSTTYDSMCANPRAGTADRAGTRTDENNWLRSWTNELYLWYGEVTDRDPSLYTSSLTYFDCAEDQRDHRLGSAQGQVPFLLTTRTTGWRCRRAEPRPAMAPSSPCWRPTPAAPHRRGVHRTRHAGRRATRARR